VCACGGRPSGNAAAPHRAPCQGPRGDRAARRRRERAPHSRLSCRAGDQAVHSSTGANRVHCAGAQPEAHLLRVAVRDAALFSVRRPHTAGQDEPQRLCAAPGGRTEIHPRQRKGNQADGRGPLHDAHHALRRRHAP
ncbi:hypothetical protein IWQ56_003826, partial [Coemansia nantahalensis]